MIQVGRVKAIFGPFVEMEEAAWIADTGRLMGFILGALPNEVEPFPTGVVVNTGSLIDAWRHPMTFSVQKWLFAENGAWV